MRAAKKQTVRRMVESAVMLAVGTVLSLFPLQGFWALGGGITICSTLPLVIISWRYGWGWGAFTAVIYGLLQMVLGIQNVQYADSVQTAAAIVLLDYLAAFGVIGLAGLFRGWVKNGRVGLVLGITTTFSLRFACHYATGVWIWESLWPNELGWAAPVWSLAYNCSYMIPELILSALVCLLSYAPLRRYYEGDDLR